MKILHFKPFAGCLNEKKLDKQLKKMVKYLYEPYEECEHGKFLCPALHHGQYWPKDRKWFQLDD